MAKSDKQFNPYLAKQIGDSYKKNYGHVFADLFTQLGNNKIKAQEKEKQAEFDDIKLQTAKNKLADYDIESETKKLNLEKARKLLEDYDLESETKKINLQKAKNQLNDYGIESETKKQKLNLNTMNYENAKNKVADNKLVRDYISSNYSDLNTYLEDTGQQFKTADYQMKAQGLSDEKMSKTMDEALAGHELYLQEKGLLLDDNGNIDIAQVRKQLAKDSNNLELAQAFERKYGSKLNNVAKEPINKTAEILNYEYGLKNPEFKKLSEKKKNKSLTINEQIKLEKYEKEKEKEKEKESENERLQKDLSKVKENYKELYGKDMTLIQEKEYTEKGKKPYLSYGTNDLNNKRKELIDANLAVEKVLTKLDDYTYEDFDAVAGWWQGMNPVISAKDAIDKLTPRQKKLRQILGEINSEKMHQLYGAALTGGEIGRAKTWNLDMDQSTSSLLTAINSIRSKNKIEMDHNTYGVHGVPKENMSFKMFDTNPSSEKNNTQKNDNQNTQKKITVEEALKMGIKFNEEIK